MGLTDCGNHFSQENNGSGKINAEGITVEERGRSYILKENRPLNIHGEVIGKIAGSFYFVTDDTTIYDLSELLIESDDITVVGVVSESGKIRGVISKEYLTSMLSKPFGRELFINKTVETAVKQVPEFNFNRNIFSVSDEIAASLNIKKTRYYILHNDRMEFAGIFSSDDLLLYLSDLTQRDIAMAKQLQSLIVKDELEINTPYCSFLAASKMARGVGGDYYLIKQYSENRYMLTLCDVSGKGMSASLLSVLLDGMLNIYNLQQGIKEFIVALNGYLLNTFMLEKYITGVFIDLDEKSGSAVIYDMGHSYGCLIRDGRFVRLQMKHGNLPVGVEKEYLPRENRFRFLPGDLLLIYSDGAEEQKNPSGEEFGISRIAEILNQSVNMPLKEIKNRLLDDIKRFRGNQTQLDDITMILIKYHFRKF